MDQNTLNNLYSSLSGLSSAISSGQVTKDNAGQFVPTLQKLSKSLSGFSSSAMPQQNNAQQNAAATGTNSLLNPWGNYPTQPTSSAFQQYEQQVRQAAKDQLKQFNQQQNTTNDVYRQIFDSQYNTGLARINHQYDQAFRQLSEQREKAVNIARTQSSQLNPYSGPSSAQQGYQQKINQAFNDQAANLQRQAELAQQELEAGRAENYFKLQAQMAQQQQQFQAGIQNMLLGLGETRIQNEQFQFGILDKAQDNLRQFVQMSGVPDSLIGKTPDQWTMQEITPYLQYAMSQGIGMDRAMEILPALLSGQTIAQQRLALQAENQANLEAYRWAALANSINNQGTFSLQTDPMTGEAFYLNSRTLQRIPYTPTGGIGLNPGGTTAAATIAPVFSDALTQINNRFKYQPAQKQAGFYAIQDALNKGNEAEARLALENHLLGGLSTGAQDIMAGTQSLSYNLRRIEEKLTDLKAKGKSTGFIEGTTEKALQLIGNSNDPDLAELRSYLEAVKFSYINQISGKQFTDKERTAYGVILPNISNWDDLNLAKIRGVSSALENQKKNVIRSVIGDTNYQQLYGTSATAPTNSFDDFWNQVTAQWN